MSFDELMRQRAKEKSKSKEHLANRMKLACYLHQLYTTWPRNMRQQWMWLLAHGAQWRTFWIKGGDEPIAVKLSSNEAAYIFLQIDKKHNTQHRTKKEYFMAVRMRPRDDEVPRMALCDVFEIGNLGASSP